jgi:hypothetical protein
MPRLHAVVLACVLVVVTQGSAPSVSVASRVPTCRELVHRDYQMFSRAGNRAVGRVVAGVAPRCRRHRLREATVLRKVRDALGRVAERYDEVSDTAVLDTVADALEASGAVRRVDALVDILPS